MNRKTVSLIGLVLIFCLTSSVITYAITVSLSFNTIIEAGSMVSSYGYIVSVDGSTYYAKNGTTGAIDFISSNASYVIQSAIDYGYSVFITRGNYTLSNIISIPTAHHIAGVLEQWVGNTANPYPVQAGTNLFFSGSDPSSVNMGVLNITAINDVLIENLAIESNLKTSPYKNMSAIQISNSTAGPHRITLRNVYITGFKIGIGTLGGIGPVDSVFSQITIQNCSIGIQITNTGNYFESLFTYQNEYDVEFIASAPGTHGTTFQKCFFNSPIYESVWIYSGNETETSFSNCWFEAAGSDLLYIEPSAITVRILSFIDCHLHTTKVGGYMFDFSKVVNGLVKFDTCFFDGTSGTTITINNSTYFEMESCWQKTDADGLKVYTP